MRTGHFPNPARMSTPRTSNRRPVGVAAVLTSLVLLGGCALTPAAAGPISVPGATAPTPSTVVATPGATASTSVSATASPSPSPTATKPPDPLAGLKPALRKQFKACLSTTMRPGSSGECARFLQKQLKKAGFYPGRIASYVNVAAVNAVLNYQRSRGLDADGWAGTNTWLALATKTPTVSAELPKTCLTKGVVLCVDQAHRTLTWLRNGKTVKTFKVRLGGYNQHAKTKIWRNFPTANGTWHVYDKQVSPASETYGPGAMPYSTMFYPDMYVHYSPGFNNVGYAGSSHGCVNIRKLSDAQWIFRNTPIGAKVHIFSPKA